MQAQHRTLKTHVLHASADACVLPLMHITDARKDNELPCTGDACATDVCLLTIKIKICRRRSVSRQRVARSSQRQMEAPQRRSPRRRRRCGLVGGCMVRSVLLVWYAGRWRCLRGEAQKEKEGAALLVDAWCALIYTARINIVI